MEGPNQPAGRGVDANQGETEQRGLVEREAAGTIGSEQVGQALPLGRRLQRAPILFQQRQRHLSMDHLKRLVETLPEEGCPQNRMPRHDSLLVDEPPTSSAPQRE